MKNTAEERGGSQGGGGARGEWAAAVGMDDWPALESLLRDGLDASSTDFFGMSPLHVAAKDARLACLRGLLDWGARADGEGFAVDAPLIYAMAGGGGGGVSAERLACVGEILNRGARCVSSKTGMSPLMIAASLASAELVEMVAGLQENPGAMGPRGVGAMHMAAQADAAGCISMLSRRCSSTERDSQGRTPLMHAAACGAASAIEALWMADPAGALEGRAEALGCAISHGKAQAAVALAHYFAGAMPMAWEASFDGERPAFTMALLLGQDQVALALIPYSLPSEAWGPKKTPLMEAARFGALACVEALLPASDPDARDLDGQNALMNATLGGSIACVERLGGRSAREARNGRGQTAEDLAERGGEVRAYLAALREADELGAESEKGGSRKIFFRM